MVDSKDKIKKKKTLSLKLGTKPMITPKNPNHKKTILMKQVLMKINHLISMKQILMKINLELYLNHFRKMNKREF